MVVIRTAYTMHFKGVWWNSEKTQPYCYIIISIVNFNGCESPKITEGEAISIVMERLGGLGGDSEEVKIKAVSHRFGEYKVEWEIDAACEFGTGYIDDQIAKIVKGEETNC